MRTRPGCSPARATVSAPTAASLSEARQPPAVPPHSTRVTLYGCDPDERPDIYGKVGNSGVSIATLDDLKVLYSGFDLCSPTTSVSMTINGPAPMILAMFINTAIDQQIEKFERDHGRQPTDDEIDKIREWAQENMRGTVQADILKEDQGQNTCIFSTEFALKMMGDIRSISFSTGYATSIRSRSPATTSPKPAPIRSRSSLSPSPTASPMWSLSGQGHAHRRVCAQPLLLLQQRHGSRSTVMGRVARRIWATAMRFKYGGNERSQKLKYHIQTSGRSLHAQEMDFNDIRTTLQALIAIYDNCNSLHTNAFDEAITTPSEESVRRALAIQLIINNEWGLARNENPNQGHSSSRS